MHSPNIEDLRKKWREIPLGNERMYSNEMSSLDDDRLRKLLAQHKRIRGEGSEIGWYFPLYRDSLRGKRVLEIGSGTGLDGITFMKYGAHWTFSDIVQSNLDVVKRNIRLEDLDPATAEYLYIDQLDAFSRLNQEYDFIWADGSLINLSFDDARIESLGALTCLRPGGRWIELTYPKKRWVRDGSPHFSKWGEMTDGPGTPWMEWYDTDRLLQRLSPAKLRKVFSYDFCHSAVNWHDLELLEQFDPADANRPQKPRVSISFEGAQLCVGGPIHSEKTQLSFSTDAALWAYTAFLPFKLEQHGEAEARIECTVTKGSIGAAFVKEDLQFAGTEIFIDQGDSGPFRITTDQAEAVCGIVFRNVSGGGKSEATVTEVEIY